MPNPQTDEQPQQPQEQPREKEAQKPNQPTQPSRDGEELPPDEPAYGDDVDIETDDVDLRAGDEGIDEGNERQLEADRTTPTDPTEEGRRAVRKDQERVVERRTEEDELDEE